MYWKNFNIAHDNLSLQRTRNYKKLKFCRLSLVARTRPVGTLSAISINFAKG